MSIKATIEGGRFDGLDLDLQEHKIELLLEDTSSGRAVVHRYVLQYTDADGVRHYYRQWQGETV